MTMSRTSLARRSLSALAVPLGLIALGLLPAPVQAQATSTQAQKLFPAAGADYASFGRACLVQGDVAIITANGADTSGAAYCYRRVGGVWTPSQKFKGSDTAQGDFFGFEAAIDGDIAVIGAQQADAPGSGSGAACIFQDNGTSWTQVQKLVAPDGAAGDSFGGAIGLGGDLIVVGASQDDDAGASSGAAYVFRRAGATWVFEQKLQPSTADSLDQFGWDIATDGEVIIISSIEDEQAGKGTPGAVFVFESNGTSWQQVQRIVPADAANGDYFGWDLDLDGDALAIGSPNTDAPAVNGGAVYIYRSNGATWSLEDKVSASKVAADHALGWSLDLQGDRLVAGAPSTGATFSGALYQFHSDGTHWVQVHQWLTSDTAVAAFPPPQLGMSCGFDGKTVFGGAPFHDGAVVNAGAAYRFELTDIGLQAVAAGGVLTLSTYGGLAGAPMAVLLKSIAGVPLDLLVVLDTFNVQGQETLLLAIPAAASGLEAKFLSAGYWQPGFKALSNVASVTFP